MRKLATGAIVVALGISLFCAPLPAVAETSEDVRAEVAGVQAELDDLAGQIADGEAHVRELQDQVDALAEESVQLQTQIIVDRDRLSDIVSTSYKDGADARTLALLLSSETMDELISQVYYAQKVSDWQAECIDRLNSDKQALDVRMAEISAAKDEQTAELEVLSVKREELNQKVAVLAEKADRLEEEEREAARRAAEEAARKAAEEQAAREAEERARQEAIKAAAAVGDVKPTQGGTGWISCVASAYTIADNDPPGSTATASGIPLDESVPTVAMPMSMSPSRFYGSKVEISYNGMSVIATVTDCGYMGGGSRGLDLTPAVFRAFGASSADEWGLRTVSYRFL
ncbi:MAG: hypothetical protein J6D34_06770 [Atopobiaceae bacterium]|nr:hypothetical protein [Atopobiaceae bacterium]